MFVRPAERKFLKCVPPKADRYFVTLHDREEGRQVADALPSRMKLSKWLLKTQLVRPHRTSRAVRFGADGELLRAVNDNILPPRPDLTRRLITLGVLALPTFEVMTTAVASEVDQQNGSKIDASVGTLTPPFVQALESTLPPLPSRTSPATPVAAAEYAR